MDEKEGKGNNNKDKWGMVCFSACVNGGFIGPIPAVGSVVLIPRLRLLRPSLPPSCRRPRPCCFLSSPCQHCQSKIEKN